ncbi:MAG: SpoIIE family protein phosphatase [Armatimonadota bacterium]|nr:SpoIIE family protein phosphatase [Armatimonadota bacterium]
MPSTDRKISLKIRLLVVLLAAVIIPSVVIAGILVRTGAEREQRRIFAEMQAVAEAVSDDISEFMGNVQSILVTASLSHAYWVSRRQALTDLQKKFPFFKQLAIYDFSGIVQVIVRQKGATWQPPQVLTRAAIKEAMAGRNYTSDVQFVMPHYPLVLVAVPIGQPGEPPSEVLFGVVSLETPKDIISKIRMGRGGYVFVVDKKGRVIAHPLERMHLIGADFSRLGPVRQALEGKTDTALTREDIFTDPSGREVAGVFHRIPDLGWVVVVQVPVSEAFGSQAGTFAIALAWAFLFAVLFGLFGLYLVRRVTIPISKLKEGAEAIGAGNLSWRINVRTRDELEDLADALNRMAENLEVSRRQLEEEHDRAVKAAREANILFRVSQSLVFSMDLEHRLMVVARNLADVCDASKAALWLVENGYLKPAISHGLSAEEKEFHASWSLPLSAAAQMVKEAVERRKPIVIHDAANDPRVPPEFAEKLKLRSLLAVPLVFHENVIGYGITFTQDELRRFTRRQVRLAQAVAAQGAVAIENARAYERERRISETLQRSFLPDVPQVIGSFQFADRYEAALAEAQIGGDFYDVIEISPDKVALVMADVSGKGLSAAIHTALIKYTVRAYAIEGLDPIGLITKLNKAVYKFIGGQVFITCFYGVLDTVSGVLEYVNAGHELPLLNSSRRKLCMSLATTGTALGIVESFPFTSKSIKFEPGDVLLLYTDGATEARRNGQFLGIEGLEEMFCQFAHEDALYIVDQLDLRIREYAKGVLHDDLALLVVKAGQELK